MEELFHRRLPVWFKQALTCCFIESLVVAPGVFSNDSLNLYSDFDVDEARVLAENSGLTILVLERLGTTTNTRSEINNHFGKFAV